jgi:hypothetical protein
MGRGAFLVLPPPRKRRVMEMQRTGFLLVAAAVAILENREGVGGHLQAK